nr:sorting nexin-3-like [Odocoileus virginianus texanus]
MLALTHEAIGVCHPMSSWAPTTRRRRTGLRPPTHFPQVTEQLSDGIIWSSSFGAVCRSSLKHYAPHNVVVPPLPGKAFLRQLPFRGDDGIFDDNFIEERKQGLEQFINKVAGHPLAQNERCLHMFLQDEIIDKSYTPSKIRHA